MRLLSVISPVGRGRRKPFKACEGKSMGW